MLFNSINYNLQSHCFLQVSIAIVCVVKYHVPLSTKHCWIMLESVLFLWIFSNNFSMPVKVYPYKSHYIVSYCKAHEYFYYDNVVVLSLVVLKFSSQARHCHPLLKATKTVSCSIALVLTCQQQCKQQAHHQKEQQLTQQSTERIHESLFTSNHEEDVCR